MLMIVLLYTRLESDVGLTVGSLALEVSTRVSKLLVEFCPYDVTTNLSY